MGCAFVRGLECRGSGGDWDGVGERGRDFGGADGVAGRGDASGGLFDEKRLFDGLLDRLIRLCVDVCGGARGWGGCGRCIGCGWSGLDAIECVPACGVVARGE